MGQRMSPEEFRRSEKVPLVVVLENVRSGLNVGSVFRSADSFRIQKLFLGGYTPCPPHREVLKTALGATQSVEWEHAPDVVDLCVKLKSAGYSICAAEQTPSSINIRNFDALAGKGGTVVVFGNEVNGVSREVLQLCDKVLEIPQHGTKQSLNVAVCAGIVMFELCSRLTSHR